MSVAVMAAEICVVLTKVVVRALPFQLTTELEIKLVPFTFIVKAAPPAVALLGERDVIVGLGLFVAVTVKESALEIPPPGAGFVTVTWAVPAVAISAAAIVAVSCVVLTNVVKCALPFQLTIDLGRKFVPFTVRVNAAPAAVELIGEREVTVGAGLDVPPLLSLHPASQTTANRLQLTRTPFPSNRMADLISQSPYQVQRCFVAHEIRASLNSKWFG
jgi:hypothetical protein